MKFLSSTLSSFAQSAVILLIAFLGLFCSSCSREVKLFPITQNGKTGYINENGKVVIEPKFENGFVFSEGLAAVRSGGYYGFIDSQGEFVIKPQFDLATRFLRGRAFVYKNGQPIVINNEGKVVFKNLFSSMAYVNDDLAIVTTPSSKVGLWDFKKSKLLADTIFAAISEFSEGRAVVRITNPDSNGFREDYGVIDMTGAFVVKPGIYFMIGKYSEGLARIQTYQGHDNEEAPHGVIDRSGKLLFTLDPKLEAYISGGYHNGLAAISYRRYTGQTTEDQNQKRIFSYIDRNGKIRLSDTNNIMTGNFNQGIALVSKETGRYDVIDTNFRVVSTVTATFSDEDIFDNGYAIARDSHVGYGVIDTAGRWILKPSFESVEQVGSDKRFFFFSKRNENNEYLYGIADKSGSIIVPPIMNEFDHSGFSNGLLRAVIDNRMAYINEAGKIIWKGIDESKMLKANLNIDFMLRNYFLAASAVSQESNGWYQHDRNSPAPISRAESLPNDILLKISEDSDTVLAGVRAHFFFVMNNSSKPVICEAQDSKLYIALQARDENGIWRDISYTPNSWCGNSYHTLELPSKNYWKFKVYSFDGAIKTSMRAVLAVNSSSQKAFIYSNEIRTSVNPGQFWHKPDYIPTNIMDPYIE